MKGTQLAYRPDIDGLRGLAVMLVLLFHFDLGVSGGFIGVDVFFVISGYLITGVIRNAVMSGRFSFTEFYIKRLIRLHPALLVTVALCLVAGFMIMDPASLSSLSDSATYAALSASNFFFWLNQGYFAADAHTSPLLHTWSLAAEWQFYLVWPLIVWGALKVSTRTLALVLVATTISSLIASQLMLGHDASAAYYLMPFRVFELSIGALIVLIPPARLADSAGSFLTTSGIGAILYAAFTFSAEMPFPGFAALVPCLGAAACIYAGQSTAGALLRSSPPMFLGLISYSVYLVHWPLYVFYSYYVMRDVSVYESLTLLASSILIGWAMYTFVEARFIKRPGRGVTQRLAFAGIATIAIAAASIFTTIDGGFAFRIPDKYVEFSSGPADFHKTQYGGQGFKLSQVLGNESGRPVAVISGTALRTNIPTVQTYSSKAKVSRPRACFDSDALFRASTADIAQAL